MSASTRKGAPAFGAPRRGVNPHPQASGLRIVAGAAAAILAAGSLTIGAAAPAIAATDPLNPFQGIPAIEVFEPAGTNPTAIKAINDKLRAAEDAGSHWSPERKAFFFKPGTYGDSTYAGTVDDDTKIINSQIGYYTQVSGLGASPNDVKIVGALHVDAQQDEPQTCPGSPWGPPTGPESCKSPGALNNFWRSLSNVTITPKQFAYGADALLAHPEGGAEANEMRWAVSQASPIRRVHIEGDLNFMPRYGQYSSGGFASEIKVDGRVTTGSQQQFFFRNSALFASGGSYDDRGVWNMVFSGVSGAPATDFPDSLSQGPSAVDNNKWTNVANTPISREAPFLTWNASQGYSVFVPAAATNTSGVSWTPSSAGAGTSISLADFFVAKPTDSVDTINAALDANKHLIFSPGRYLVDKPIVVRKANTVVLGLGLATLTPTTSETPMKVADVAGVKIAGLMFDAGERLTTELLKVGPIGATVSDPANPTTLSDVFFRVGGMNKGRTDTSLEVNSPGVLIDNIWAWRADHHAGGTYLYTDNYAPTGVRVNGDNVTALGLFAEHYYQNQAQWNGDNGNVIFYQSELPYEVTGQNAYRDGNREGFASYWVDSDVTTHSLTGAGVYSFFRDATAFASTGISVPRKSGVKVTNAVARALNGFGGIRAVVNNVGKQVNVDPTNDHNATSWLRNYDHTVGGDSQAPVITLAPNPASPDSGDTYTTAVNLWVTATDNTTPASDILLEYKIDDRIWKRVVVDASGKGLIHPPNGEHIVHVRATDTAGNAAKVQQSFKVDAGNNPGDLTDPEPGVDPDIGGPQYPVNPDPTDPQPVDVIKPLVNITANPAAPNGPGGTYNTAVTLTISGSDDQTENPALAYRTSPAGAWTPYGSPIVLSSNGSYTIEAQSTDGAGNKSVIRSWTGTVNIDGGTPADTTPPVVTISSNPAAPGANGKYSTAVTVTISGTDDSGVAPSIEYRINNGAWSSYAQPLVFNANGSYTVEARGRDGSANLSAVKTWTGMIQLPTPVVPPVTPPWNLGSNPAGTITVGPRLTATIHTTPKKPAKNRKWFRKAVTVRLTGTAPAGTRAVVQLKIRNGAWKTYAGPVTIKKTGLSEIQARTVTMTQQSASISRLLRIDRVKPKKIKVKVKTLKKRTVIRLRFTATDKHSKVLKFRYKLPGQKKWKNLSAAKAKKGGVRLSAKKAKTRKIIRSLSGKKVIRIRVYDKAANKSKIVKLKLTKKVKRTLKSVL